MSEVPGVYRTARQTLDRAMTEAALQRAIVELAELAGWLWWHDVDSRRNRPGYPDLILVKAGHHAIFAELKRERGRLRRSQRAWMAVLGEVPGIVVRVWRPSDWPEIERTLTAGREGAG